MRTFVLVTVLIGCGGSTPTPAPVPAPAPIAVGVAPDAALPDAAPVVDPGDPSGPAAAVPIPDETMPPPPLEMVDTTITDADVAGIAGWPAAKKSANGGEIWVVLHTIEGDKLELALVRDDEGVRASYALGKAKRIQTELTYDGDAFPARDHVGDYQGPIVFAARVTAPGATTADQIVVFGDGATLRVARRPLGATAWKPVLSVAFKKGATFRGIGTTDPH